MEEFSNLHRVKGIHTHKSTNPKDSVICFNSTRPTGSFSLAWLKWFVWQHSLDWPEQWEISGNSEALRRRIVDLDKLGTSFWAKKIANFKIIGSNSYVRSSCLDLSQLFQELPWTGNCWNTSITIHSEVIFTESWTKRMLLMKVAPASNSTPSAFWRKALWGLVLG